MAQPESGKGAAAAVEEAAVRKLKADLRGPLLLPGDDGYDAARRVWNAMIDRRPAMIARCAGVADVVHAVRLARHNHLLVAVRGGGHNVAGNAVCDGGIVIDLSLMKGIRVDPARRTAHAQAGLTWGEFDRETQAFGLATTGGLVSTTGIAGLTLGGGIGWLMGKHGLTCDNLLSADVVTADGRFLTASATEKEDLFWGLRGGGGNFGIVTSFEYDLHPVGPVVGGMVAHPLARTREVLRFLRDFMHTVPDELTVTAVVLTTPDGIPVIAIAVCYAGPVVEGEQAVKPLRAFGPPVMDQIAPIGYTELQRMVDASGPPGKLNYWKSADLMELSDAAIDVLTAHSEMLPSPQSIVVIHPRTGAVQRVDPEKTAFGDRSALYTINIVSMWEDPARSEAQIQWARKFWDALQPLATGGAYVNFMGDEGEGGVRAAYGAAKYERLVALKNTYDPANFFRLNHNIRPTV